MSVNSLKHPRSLTSVPDPIHGKFVLNLFDRDLIDSEFFQRLHFVSQNAANFTSFPSNKNSRFPHSIGVSHTCGRLFSSALSNASSETLNYFLKDAASFLAKTAELIKRPNAISQRQSADRLTNAPFHDAHFKTISGLAGFVHSPIHFAQKDTGSSSDDQRIDTEETFKVETAEGNNYEFTAAFIIDSLWQAVRVYGLMHDLGHLPTSHSFESALTSLPESIKRYEGKQEIRDEVTRLTDEKRSGFPDDKDDTKLKDLVTKLSKLFCTEDWPVEPEDLQRIAFHKELHETRGINLYIRFIRKHSDVISSVKDLGSLNPDDLSYYSEFIQTIVLALYFSKFIENSAEEAQEANEETKYHPFSFLYAIRQIVDGYTDGDRMDYVLRDCHETGSQFGVFDLERIVANSVLLHDSNRKRLLYCFGFHFRAVSGVEQFFETRYQTYKYVVFHRTSARTNKCLEELISLMFIYAIRFPGSRICEILIKYGYLNLNTHNRIGSLIPDTEKFIASIDDYTFRTLLFEVRDMCVDVYPKSWIKPESDKLVESIHQIEDLRTVPEFKDVEDPDLFVQIKCLIDTVLLRDLRHVYSVQKNIPFREMLRQLWLADDRNENQFNSFFGFVVGSNSDDLSETLQNLSSRLKSELQIRNLLLIKDTILPKLLRKDVGSVDPNRRPFEQSISVLGGDSVIRPIEYYSSTLRYLNRRYDSDPEIRIYAVAPELKRLPDKCAALDRIFDAIQTSLLADYDVYQERLQNEA